MDRRNYRPEPHNRAEDPALIRARKFQTAEELVALVIISLFGLWPSPEDVTRGNLIWPKRIIKRDRPLKTIVIARARAIIIGTIPDRFRWIETKPFLDQDTLLNED